MRKIFFEVSLESIIKFAVKLFSDCVFWILRKFSSLIIESLRICRVFCFGFQMCCVMLGVGFYIKDDVFFEGQSQNDYSKLSRVRLTVAYVAYYAHSYKCKLCCTSCGHMVLAGGVSRYSTPRPFWHWMAGVQWKVACREADGRVFSIFSLCVKAYLQQHNSLVQPTVDALKQTNSLLHLHSRASNGTHTDTVTHTHYTLIQIYSQTCV